MRLKDLKPGDLCFRFGIYPMEVVEVVHADPDQGIDSSYAVLRAEDGREVRATGHVLLSEKEVQERLDQKNGRDLEVADIARQMQISLPSFQADAVNDKREMKICINQEDCLKVLDLLDAKTPGPHGLPDGHPLDSDVRLEKAILLAQRTRRALGKGRCSHYQFPWRDWQKGGRSMMYMILADETVYDLLDRLQADAPRPSALAGIFSS